MRTKVRNMKKSTFLLGAIAGILFSAISAADAQRQSPPYDLWCRDQAIADSSTLQICMAYTLQQCLYSRTAPGENCYLNPRYDPRYRR